MGEIEAAVDFVQRGGTLLLNAADQNVANSNAWLALFGLEAVNMNMGCDPPHFYSVMQSADPEVARIVDGSFGNVTEFRNRCESPIRAVAGSTFGSEGVIPLAVTSNSEQAVLALVPSGVQGAGQVVVITNLHVFHDPDALGGGFMDTANSRSLLLNIASSLSVLDENGNGLADECEIPPQEVIADGEGDKVRFISFSVPPSMTPVAVSALRVSLVSMHHVVPPYSGGPSIPFTGFESQIRWVGPPTLNVESSSNPVPFYAASLGCGPHYQDWSTVGLLHVTGSAITPSSTFEVENISGVCAGTEENCLGISLPKPVSTRRWGDVTDPYNPPSATVQPDIADIGALVNKFRSAPGSPIKARALLAGAPGNPFGEITPAVLSVDLSFAHISACVDAFRGVPYPHTIGACP